MFASTTRARALLKLAFDASNVDVPRHTYTERTTDADTERRSVVFPIWNDEGATKVFNFATRIFKEAGYAESKIRLTRSDYSGCSYIRVIAYKNT